MESRWRLLEQAKPMQLATELESLAWQLEQSLAWQ
jgi:hypothetical protein